MKTCTLKDIADEVGCSAMLVSRILNDRSNTSMKSRYREKVLEVAERLHYSRSNAAAFLRTGKSKTFGMVAGSVTGHTQGCIIDSLFNECIQRGYQFRMALTSYNQIQEQMVLEDLFNERPDGIFYQPDLNMKSRIAMFLQKQKYPLLLVDGILNHGYRCFNEISYDHSECFDTMFRTLMERGKRKIGIWGAKFMSIDWEDYAKKYGFEYVLIKACGPDYASLMEGARQIRASKQDALVMIHGELLSFYLNHVRDYCENRPEIVFSYEIPAHFTRCPECIGGIVRDTRTLVSSSVSRMIDMVERPDQPIQCIAINAKFATMDELSKLYEDQTRDPWYKFYSL